MRKCALVLLGVALLGLDASPVTAQVGSASVGNRSSTQGFVIGLGANGSSIKFDDAEFGDEQQTGPGVNFLVGYNFTPQIGILLNTSVAMIDDDDDGFGLGQADLALRYAFASPSRAFAPYLEVGYTGLAAMDELEDSDVRLTGTGFTGALGMNYFFSRGVALDMNFRYTAGEFTSFTVDGEEMADGATLDATTGRFNIGLSFFP